MAVGGGGGGGVMRVCVCVCVVVGGYCVVWLSLSYVGLVNMMNY